MFGPAAAWALGVAYQPGSYAGVSGRSDGLQFLDNLEDITYPPKWRGALHIVGFLGYRPERFSDVLDGLSSTLLGESVTRTNPPMRKLWACSQSFYSLSSTVPQERALLGDYDRCQQIGGRGHGAPCQRGWGSRHPGGADFLLCDGSVHFIHNTIDLELFARLGTIAGGETATAP